MSVESLVPDDLPTELQAPARQWLERFLEAHPDTLPNAGHVRLAAISEFAGRTMLRYGGQSLDVPDDRAVDEFADAVGASDQPVDVVKRELREYRNRFLTALIYADMMHPQNFVDTLNRWSRFADRMREAASRYALRRVEKRFGQISNGAGEPVTAVILGVGMSGG